MGKSHQSGWVVLRGKKWYGYYRRTVLDPITNERKTDVVSLILGLKSQLTKGVAREALQKEIAKQTGQNLDGRIMRDGSAPLFFMPKAGKIVNVRVAEQAREDGYPPSALHHAGRLLLHFLSLIMGGQGLDQRLQLPIHYFL